MQETRFDIHFIGGACVDIILRVPRLPSRDEKLVARYLGKQAGGLVANTACAASVLGLNVSWTGKLGDDENGRTVKQSFEEFSVNTDFLVLDPEIETDFTIVLLDPSGERTILIVPTTGSADRIRGTTLDAVKNSEITYTLPNHYEWFNIIAEAVHESGGKLAIDIEGSLAIQGSELESIIAHSDIVFCSQSGLKLATGTEDPEIGGKEILGLGIECVCVTLGKLGAWAATVDQQSLVPAFDVPVIDTTGAGDCFHAAFLDQYLKQEAIEDCLRFSNAAAAISIQEIGARGSLPKRNMIEKFLQLESQDNN